MEAIIAAANISVGRACGFAGLGIFCLMFGLSFEPALSARAGGMLCAILAAVLYLYAHRAPARPYKRTELWTILRKPDRPPPEVAQKIIGDILRDAYLKFARQTAIVSAALWIVALILEFLP